ncbi:hypothetical protein niasHT_021458 [Heterodera trifolii]|uniref:Uncharacterized protein n=1 Tax=Heterodera trifolii TaxID=157864 RepID=A0ABD2KIU0_9BILA
MVAYLRGDRTAKTLTHSPHTLTVTSSTALYRLRQFACLQMFEFVCFLFPIRCFFALSATISFFCSMSSFFVHHQQKRSSHQQAAAVTLADIRWMEPMAATESAATSSTPAKRLLARLGTTRVGRYVQQLAIDYAASCRDIVVGMRQRPLRAVACGAALASLLFTLKSNPDEIALRARLAQLRQQMVLIPASIHSTRADERLEQYTVLLNGNRLELVDFLLFSVLVERPFDKKNDFYAAHDKTLRGWPWTELWRNAWDIGAFGRFWALERSFANCDVRHEEWEGKGQQKETKEEQN